MKYNSDIRSAMKKATSINIRSEFGKVTMEICNDTTKTTLDIGTCDRSFYCYNSTFTFTGIGLLMTALLKKDDKIQYSSFYDEKHCKYIELRITRKDKHLCDIPFHFDFK